MDEGSACRMKTGRQAGWSFVRGFREAGASGCAPSSEKGKPLASPMPPGGRGNSSLRAMCCGCSLVCLCSSVSQTKRLACQQRRGLKLTMQRTMLRGHTCDNAGLAWWGLGRGLKWRPQASPASPRLQQKRLQHRQQQPCQRWQLASRSSHYGRCNCRLPMRKAGHGDDKPLPWC